MDVFLLSSTRLQVKIVGQTKFWSLNRATSLGEKQLNSNSLTTHQGSDFEEYQSLALQDKNQRVLYKNKEYLNEDRSTPIKSSVQQSSTWSYCD